ncbi:MAG: hypothetical protein E7169_04545 [Firmicutes bacterium]|nr:hypothetical protein [Bacillota bacterium]
MKEDKIKKAIDNASSNVSIEDMENKTRDLNFIKEALIRTRDNKSFLHELVKLVQKEHKEKGSENGKGKK